MAAITDDAQPGTAPLVAAGRPLVIPAASAITKHNRRILELLSREGSAGGTPAVLGIQATQLKRLVSLGLLQRLPPFAPRESYRYRISEAGTVFLNPRE